MNNLYIIEFFTPLISDSTKNSPRYKSTLFSPIYSMIGTQNIVLKVSKDIFLLENSIRLKKLCKITSLRKKIE